MYKKILLIDDDEDEQFFFSEALKELNIPAKFCAASSPEEGIELMKFLLPDMVFIDINMPLLNGFECVKLIKHDETINKIPIVLYSTMADSSMLQQAIETG